jgi:hypothetical protein
MSKFDEKDFENLVKKTIIKEADSLKVWHTDVQLLLYLHEGETPKIKVLHNYKHNGRTLETKDLLGWKSLFVSESKEQEIEDGIKEAMLKGVETHNIAAENINIMFVKHPKTEGLYVIWLHDGKKAIKQMIFKELLN